MIDEVTRLREQVASLEADTIETCELLRIQLAVVNAEHAEMLATLKKLQQGIMFLPAVTCLIARIEGSDNVKA